MKRSDFWMAAMALLSVGGFLTIGVAPILSVVLFGACVLSFVIAVFA